jgi:hypothetical protein
LLITGEKRFCVSRIDLRGLESGRGKEYKGLEMPASGPKLSRVWTSAACLLITGLFWGGISMAQQSGSSGSPPPSSSKTPNSQDSRATDPDVTRLKIVVTNSDSKPVGNASVYLRFNEAGGFMHKDKLAEMSFKTNDDGSVKVPNVPTGKVLIQVVAKGVHTYGKWYDIVKDQDTIEIKLERVTHWY